MTRQASSEIEPWFLERWSPRAMAGTALSETELKRLFEAARWAPSSGNAQPWRFLYARANTPQFGTFLGLLVEGNRVWAARAGALLVVLSKQVGEDGKAKRTHSFDAGAAWMSLALQGSRMGLVVHGMEGFDYERARTELNVPTNVTVECMVALGHPGRVEDLPPHLAAREQPSSRNEVTTFAFEGAFPSS
jgi:nitroreductase